MLTVLPRQGWSGQEQRRHPVWHRIRISYRNLTWDWELRKSPWSCHLTSVLA